MKKVVLSLAVLFTVALVSCSGNKKEAAESDSMVPETTMQEDTTPVVDSPVADSTIADSNK